MPKKNTSIIRRRPQRSPRRPAGSEPRPNSMNAPTPYGISVFPIGEAEIRRDRRDRRREDQQEHVVDRVRDVEQQRNGAGGDRGHRDTSRGKPLQLRERAPPESRRRVAAAVRSERAPARTGQAHAGILRHLRDQRFDPREIGVAAGERVRIDDEERLPDPRAGCLRRRRTSSPRSPSPRRSARSRSARRRAPASRPWCRPAAASSLRGPPSDRSSVGRRHRAPSPSGIALPSFAATISLPRATSDSDRSISSGAPARRGNTAAIGLVPKSGRLPPAAAMAAGELPIASPTSPAAPTGSR